MKINIKNLMINIKNILTNINPTAILTITDEQDAARESVEPRERNCRYLEKRAGVAREWRIV